MKNFNYLCRILWNNINCLNTANISNIKTLFDFFHKSSSLFSVAVFYIKYKGFFYGSSCMSTSFKQKRVEHKYLTVIKSCACANFTNQVVIFFTKNCYPYLKGLIQSSVNFISLLKIKYRCSK